MKNRKTTIPTIWQDCVGPGRNPNEIECTHGNIGPNTHKIE